MRNRDFGALARYADRWNPESDELVASRQIAAEYEVEPTAPTTARTYTFLTRLRQPASVIEVGTGTGTGTLALMAGMPRMGVLTSVDTEADRQSVARELLDVAGVGRHRVRMITGRGEDVLSRLAAGGYDMVVLDADPTSYDRLLPLAADRLSAGGLLVIDRALGGGAVTEPTDREPRTRALRDMLSRARDRVDLHELLLPVDDGLLVLSKGDAH
ncbi:O-methyltransferase [Brevibacterium litoralis]|uniref:O-methyltransferase n=1 Tax=Brevibacterium litoralis TaxID=3138935 RepID=UPI0032EAC32F